MKMSNLKQFSILLIPVALVWASCEKDDPVPEIDQEVITEVTLKFTEVDDSGGLIADSDFEVVASDTEGISLGNSLDIDPISSLETGKKYFLEIFLYNSIADEDLTAEIAEDDTEHQFYFLGSALVGESAFLTYEYGDEDGNGNPLGLKGFVTVEESTTNTGNFRVILRHDSDKNFVGADNPHFENFEQAGGESDLDITFQVTM